MEDEKILLCMPHMSGRELDFIHKAFEGSWVVPLGPDVDAFERDLESFLGEGKRVVALSAGTAAIHLALLAAGVGPGDEVMVQSFTFSASANPVTYLGATPVFVDSEEDSWNMDPDLLDRAIADRLARTGRMPKAIVPVYLYGMPAKIDRIMEVADRYGIPVVEDSAEAFGSRYRGRACGTFGHFGVLSFNGNKMITTSGGGAVICPGDEERREIMFYATQSREPYPFYQHEHIGFNYRMSNISAAIGRGQMTVAEEHLRHHRDVHALYARLLEGVDGITLHSNPGPEFDSNYWLSTVTLDGSLRVRGEKEAAADMEKWRDAGALPAPNVEAMRRALWERKVESRPLWKPMHRQPVFSHCPSYINGVSDSLFSRGLCLPSGPWVTPAHVEKTVAVIADAIES